MRIELPGRNLVLATALVATIASVASAFSRPAALSVDGQKIVSDVPPVTQAKDVYLPLRAVADGLGADTNYDPRTGLIEVVRGSDVLRLRAGDHHATLNGSRMTLAHAPFTVRGRAMVYTNTLARALGSKVKYDGAKAKIDVTTPGFLEAGAQSDK